MKSKSSKSLLLEILLIVVVPMLSIGLCTFDQLRNRDSRADVIAIGVVTVSLICGAIVYYRGHHQEADSDK